MKNLSDATVMTIITSLLQKRETLLERCARWKERAKDQPNAMQSHATTEALLTKVDEALKELADEAAPWLKTHPDCKHLFQPAAPQPDTKEPQ
jgi:hypothetical protein